MNDVYVVQHSYELDGYDETKFIGVYSSRKNANEAIKRLKLKPGFCDHPKAFTIGRYTINEGSWQDGFNTTSNILVKNMSGIGPEWVVVTGIALIDGNYIISKDNGESDEYWQFKDKDIVRCEVTSDRNIYAIELINQNV